MKKTLKVISIILISFLLYLFIFGLLIFKWPKYEKSKLNYNVNEIVTNVDDNAYAYLVEDNEEAFNIRLSLILKAEKTIDLMYYKFKEDKAGEIFSGALLKKADEGIKITIIIDGTRDYKNDFYKTLATHSNITYKIYEPINPLLIYRAHNVLHEKILLIDSNYGLIGGRNIENRFLLKDNDTVTLDRDVLIFSTNDTSKVGLQMKDYFNELESSKYVKHFKPKKESKHNLLKEKTISMFTDYRLTNEYNLDLTLSQQAIKINNAHFIRSPLNRGNKEPVLFNVVNELFNYSDDILIQSPYITTSRLMEKDFGYRDDKNITFLTNNTETNPNMFGLSGYIKIRNKLANKHTLYEAQYVHAIHAKTITIGNNISIIGSQNIDHRSFYLSTESAVVIISEEFQEHLNLKLNNIISNSLLVNSDGTYEFKEGVIEVEKNKTKQRKIKLFSWLTSLFKEMLFKSF